MVRPDRRGVVMVEITERDRFAQRDLRSRAQLHLQWRSPNARRLDTAKRPSNTGSGNAWPHGPAVAQQRAPFERESRPRPTRHRCAPRLAHRRASSSAQTSRIERRGGIRRGDGRAASGPRPLRGRRISRSARDGVVATASSTSRMCTPATERADPFSSIAIGAREGDDRPMHALFDARGHEPDDALVPVSSNRQTPSGKSASSRACPPASASASCCMRLSSSRRSWLSCGQLASEHARRVDVVGQQALDADGHVVETPRGVQARARPGSPGRPP